MPLLSHRPQTDSEVDTCLVSIFESKSNPTSDNRASQTTVTRPTQPNDTTNYRMNVFASRSIDSNAYVGQRVVVYECSCKISTVQGECLERSPCELCVDLLCTEKVDCNWLFVQRVSHSGVTDQMALQRCWKYYRPRNLVFSQIPAVFRQRRLESLSENICK